MTLKVRLSPSGPEIGNPPAQVGGSPVAGRIWGITGAGLNAQVPGAAAGDVPGASVAVDLMPLASGYQYDVEVDANTFGTGGGWKVILLGSSDNGATYPTTIIATSDYQERGGVGRVHHWGVTLPAHIDHVKMQLQRNVPAGAALTYSPAECTARIREISPIS